MTHNSMQNGIKTGLIQVFKSVFIILWQTKHHPNVWFYIFIASGSSLRKMTAWFLDTQLIFFKAKKQLKTVRLASWSEGQRNIDS